MAMKVTKDVIHRLTVSMYCGCNILSEFKDTQCKEPLIEGAPTVFNPCEVHKGDAAISMLQFLLKERLEEAINEYNKAPVHMHSIPQQDSEDTTTGGVLAVGERIQSVMRVDKPIAVRTRPNKPPEIKQLKRDHQDKTLKSNISIETSSSSLNLDELPEDKRYTPHIEEALDFLDDRESGLLSET